MIGSALSAAVRKTTCTQVLRASYLSTDGKLMATIGVLNLPDVASSTRVGKAAGRTEFIKQLRGRRGPTRRLGQGTGLQEAHVFGHYLVLTWAEFADLRSPSGKSAKQRLEDFSAALATGTAGVNLTTRMLTGKP